MSVAAENRGAQRRRKKRGTGETARDTQREREKERRREDWGCDERREWESVQGTKEIR